MICIESESIKSSKVEIELRGHPNAIVKVNFQKFRYFSSVVVSTNGITFGTTEAIVSINEYGNLEIFKSNDWEYGCDYSWSFCGDVDKFVLQDRYGIEFSEVINEVRKLIGEDEEKYQETVTKFEDIFPE